MRRFLKHTPVHPALRLAFDRAGHPLDRAATLTALTTWKWQLASGGSLYALRCCGDQPVSVSMVRTPAVFRVRHRMDRAATFIMHETRPRLAGQAFVLRAIVRKRLLDRPPKLMINIGAGRWYAPGWKVLDHSGRWYRYAAGFVDYPHDLMSADPLPFGTATVDRFYCEHVLEHFRDERVRVVLTEMRRCLRGDGAVRIVVPDADLIYRKLRARDESFFRQRMGERYDTITDAFLTLIAHPREPVDDNLFLEALATLDRDSFLDRFSQKMQYDYDRAGEHINWFTFEKLKRMLHEAGFSSATLSSPQASRSAEMRGAAFDTRPDYSLHVDAA